MLDRLYQTALAELNEEQIFFLKPSHFNLFVNAALTEILWKLFSDLKTNVRKQNWKLDGKHLANYSEHIKQVLEFYLSPATTISKENDQFSLGENIQFIEDIYYGDTSVEKIDTQDYNLLSRNNYSAPTECSPKATKIGNSLYVSPSSIEEIKVTYVRKPAYARWTFEMVDEKPMYDPTKPDFVELDAPEILFDDLLNIVLEKAGLAKRDPAVLQKSNREEAELIQTENRQ